MTIEYDHSIVKKTGDGGLVIASSLEEGEELASGQTYEQEQERLAHVNTPSPFAQGTMTEHNKPENPSPALTVTEDGVNTRRETDEDPKPAEIAPMEVGLVATTDKEQISTVVVQADKDGKVSEAAIEAVVSGDKEYLDPPKPSDSKREWYDYAVKKGYEGEYDEVTKNELVDRYGDGS